MSLLPPGTSGHPYDDEDGSVSEVIRPAAILGEQSARTILTSLERNDVRAGGRWHAVPGLWRRFDTPWETPFEPGPSSLHLGSISCVYDQPARYTITVFRATVTPLGTHQGWTVERLCDEAFGFAGLTLASCPRADLAPPPPPFRFR